MVLDRLLGEVFTDIDAAWNAMRARGGCPAGP
jgi:hypothetical protein